jgi:hypothetical protein
MRKIFRRILMVCWSFTLILALLLTGSRWMLSRFPYPQYIRVALIVLALVSIGYVLANVYSIGMKRAKK